MKLNKMFSYSTMICLASAMVLSACGDDKQKADSIGNPEPVVTIDLAALGLGDYLDKSYAFSAASMCTTLAIGIPSYPTSSQAHGVNRDFIELKSNKVVLTYSELDFSCQHEVTLSIKATSNSKIDYEKAVSVARKAGTTCVSEVRAQEIKDNLTAFYDGMNGDLYSLYSKDSAALEITDPELGWCSKISN